MEHTTTNFVGRVKADYPDADIQDCTKVYDEDCNVIGLSIYFTLQGEEQAAYWENDCPEIIYNLSRPFTPIAKDQCGLPGMPAREPA